MAKLQHKTDVTCDARWLPADGHHGLGFSEQPTHGVYCCSPISCTAVSLRITMRPEAACSSCHNVLSLRTADISSVDAHCHHAQPDARVRGCTNTQHKGVLWDSNENQRGNGKYPLMRGPFNPSTVSRVNKTESNAKQH